MDTLDLFSIFAAAFFGAFGHCVGMCGGIVVAYSSTKIQKASPKLMQAVVHIVYSLGRITTYTVMGAAFGAIGGVISFSSTAIATLTIVAGIFMILAGLSIAGKLKFLTLLEYSFSSSIWYQQLFRSVLRSRSIVSFYVLGLLNGLLPCGLVYFFAVTAASTGSPLYGALVMSVFGISTVPSLFLLGMFSGLFSSGSFRKIMMNLAAVVVIVYGIYTVYRGYAFVENPNKSLLNCCKTKTKSDNNLTDVTKF